MASRGDKKTQKSVSAPKTRKFERKKHKWSIRSIPSAHKKEGSVPLGFALRELLGVAKNLREAKFVLKSGKVKVDGKVRTDYRFSVGLFDLLEVEGMKEKHRAVLDKKGRIVFSGVPKKTSEKICKVVGKRAAKGKKILVQLHDGKTLFLEKSCVKRGDSVKISVPANKIVEELALKEGNTVLLVSGKHVSQTAAIRQIAPGSIRKSKLITLESGGKEFQTTGENVMVIGKKAPEIEGLV